MAYVNRNYRRHRRGRAGSDDEPGGVDRRLRRLPGVRLPPRARPLLGRDRPAHRRRRPRACSAMPTAFDAACTGDPRSGRVDRSRARHADQRRARGRPPAATSTGPSSAGPVWWRWAMRVATTAPTAGRGVAMASMQIGRCSAARRRAPIRDPVAGRSERGATHGSVPGSRITWPSTPRRYDGGRATTSISRRPLTSAAIVAAAQVDPRIGPHVGGYLGDDELPASLAPAEPLARAVYETGWRPPLPKGPAATSSCRSPQAPWLRAALRSRPAHEPRTRQP